jgi:Mannosylglycerate hydrolase MGH1-like glycoside hydrolase domain
MNRRQFIGKGSLAAGALALRGSQVLAEPAGLDAPCVFTTEDAGLQRIYDAALATLAGNRVQFPSCRGPVLVEGSVYHGVWLECAPQEGEVYERVGPEAARHLARNNHLIFFALQKEDGQLPCDVKDSGPAFGQIQMQVPIAATAWELAQRLGDQELLEKAYAACGRWDAWLRKYRNTRGTGLCEGFCTYDTGQDNSPRWKGLARRCPDSDARKCPQEPGMPRLCPDLSATVYGGRVALAAMAKALGKTGEADRWSEDAQTIRQLIVEKLYDPQDGAFYDLDTDNKFVKIRSSTIMTVLGEHVPDAHVFETVWSKQVGNPKAFWAPYPFPSVALDDPQFVRPIPRNSWGGATQALTALRAPRWMEHYSKSAELGHLMQQWLEAFRRAKGEFRQQMDPETGDFTLADPAGYSPAALTCLDFVWRLSGVRQEGDGIEWNVRPVGRTDRFTRKVGTRIAELEYDGAGAALRIGGRRIGRVSGTVRLLTSPTGELQGAVGIAETEQSVTMDLPGKRKGAVRIRPNERVDWRA